MRHAFLKKGPITALAYVAKKKGRDKGKKVVHLLSSVNHTGDVAFTGGGTTKPAMIVTYNGGKSHCDMLNRQIR
jgi:hypothetical protein